MRLSRITKLGGVEEGRVVPTYDYSWDVPRHMRRAVHLINQYDGRTDRNFKTHEDQAVLWMTTVTAGFVVVPVMFVVFWLTGDLGQLINAFRYHQPDLLLQPLLTFGVGAVASMFIDATVGYVLWREPISDFLASRLFGVPAKPRLYIKQGIRRGDVWLSNKSELEQQAAEPDDSLENASEVDLLEGEEDGYEPINLDEGERLGDDGNNDPWGYPQFRP